MVYKHLLVLQLHLCKNDQLFTIPDEKNDFSQEVALFPEEMSINHSTPYLKTNKKKQTHFYDCIYIFPKRESFVVVG